MAPQGLERMAPSTNRQIAARAHGMPGCASNRLLSATRAGEPPTRHERGGTGSRLRRLRPRPYWGSDFASRLGGRIESK
jgi:hypothetical protein